MNSDQGNATPVAPQLCVDSVVPSLALLLRIVPASSRHHLLALEQACSMLRTPTAEAVCRFQALIDNCYDRPRDHSSLLGSRLASSISALRIPRDRFDEIQAAFRADLQRDRYERWEDLQRHCLETGGALAGIVFHALGARSTEAQARARLIGSAARLTFILRDLRSDLGRGKQYLPDADLKRFDVGVRQLASRRWTRPFSLLMKCQVDRARSLYRAGSHAFGHLPNDGSRLAACASALMFGGILRSIEAAEFDVFRHRAEVSPLGKIACLQRALLLCRCEVGDDTPGVF